MGTQVRELVDTFKHAGILQAQWVENFGTLFYVHRSYSILLTGLIGLWGYQNRSAIMKNRLYIGLVGVVLVEILLGAIMTYFSFPAFAQPAHLLLGTGAFGIIFYLFLLSNNSVKAI